MSEGLRSLAAVAALPAIAFLVVVHGTVLSGLFAARLVSRKRRRAYHSRQNRKQDFEVSLHKSIFSPRKPPAPEKTGRSRCSSVMKIELSFANQITVDIEAPEIG